MSLHALTVLEDHCESSQHDHVQATEEGSLSQFLQGMPSLEDTDDGILAEAATVTPIKKSKSEN